MKLSKLIITSIVIGSLLVGSLFASDSGVNGRDVVAGGAKATLAGTLTTEDDQEWSLKTGNGTYAIHFGPTSYIESTGIALKEGGKATVFGYLKGSDISPISVTMNARSYRFRDESGFPLWGGSGQGRNRSVNQDRKVSQGPLGRESADEGSGRNANRINTGRGGYGPTSDRAGEKFGRNSSAQGCDDCNES